MSMAIIEVDGKQLELKDGDKIRDTCEQLGVPFGCRSGFCGTCKSEILEGAENLNELNQEEQDMGDRDRNHRLCCQAIIKQGKVKLKPEGF